MSSHPLDNPIWSTLNSHHDDWALGTESLRRYPASMAPFLGVASEGAVTAEDLEKMVGQDETVYLVGKAPVPPPGWNLRPLGNLLQMLSERPRPDVAGPAIVRLEAHHRSAVLALTSLVYPHYFRAETMDLGRYFGIMENGRLAAMVGERMGMHGFRELSALCTHPDFAGRGLARRLLLWLSNDMHSQGLLPFLHVSPDNTRAVELYKANGFVLRHEPSFWSLAKSAQPL